MVANYKTSSGRHTTPLRSAAEVRPLDREGCSLLLLPWMIVAAVRCSQPGGSGKRKAGGRDAPPERNAGRRDAHPEREDTLSECLDFFQRQRGTRLSKTLKTKKNSQYGAVGAKYLSPAAPASGHAPGQSAGSRLHLRFSMDNGGIRTCELPLDCTVDDAKRSIVQMMTERGNAPCPTTFSLTCNGRALQGDRTLQECDVCAGATLSIVMDRTKRPAATAVMASVPECVQWLACLAMFTGMRSHVFCICVISFMCASRLLHRRPVTHGVCILRSCVGLHSSSRFLCGVPCSLLHCLRFQDRRYGVKEYGFGVCAQQGGYGPDLARRCHSY